MSVHAGWRIEGRASAVCYVYEHRPPILDLSDRSGFVLAISGGDAEAISPEHVRFARELAEAVAQYAVQCARWSERDPAPEVSGV